MLWEIDKSKKNIYIGLQTRPATGMRLWDLDSSQKQPRSAEDFAATRQMAQGSILLAQVEESFAGTYRTGMRPRVLAVSEPVLII